MNFYKKFYQKHPYLNVLIIYSIASLIGIAIEYIINRDFIGSGFYTASFLTLLELLRVRRERNKLKSKEKFQYDVDGEKD
ncbi:hypothetical protein [Trichococcus collinsii]|jgi:hypothetical protein|uniref:Uncharacterized protein n=1 Tax=Trichococcus collinsii TaxID=157076 RepID=A0AB38A1W4_9LACT|nr:hypothetical protein [Trichococcus collinsii]CZQ96654.1 Hypothetical protein Tcol_1448 [Trichococcus collinsii]SEA69851.1 hypothetical protein SAMN04488525_104230 [Trichococcus collinsii]